MSDTMHLPSVEGLPEHIKYRMQNGLRMLADAFWYRRNYAPSEDPEAFATRIGDLLVCGFGCADCEWLLRMGYLATVSRKRDIRRRKATSVRAALREQTLVVLTDAGEAELHRSGFLTDAYRFHSGHNGQGSHLGRLASIRYDPTSRELFLRDVLVLRLAASASSMEPVINGFQKELWKWSIACPFVALSNGARVQAVRDAVHSLNELQNPLRIKFHSCDKGTRIWYEIIEEVETEEASGARNGFARRYPK